MDEADWSAPPDPSRTGSLRSPSDIRAARISGAISIWILEELTPSRAGLSQSCPLCCLILPGIGLDGSKISLKTPYAPLFFYYDELCRACEENPDSDWTEDFAALAHFYCRWVKAGHDRIRRQLSEERVILYDDPWALFRPGDVLFTLDESGEPCFHVVIATEFRSLILGRAIASPSGGFPDWLSTWRVSWDSATGLFQRLSVTRSIRSFSGSRLVTSLPFHPLQYHKGGDADEIQAIKDTLQDRGAKWKDPGLAATILSVFTTARPGTIRKWKRSM